MKRNQLLQTLVLCMIIIGTVVIGKTSVFASEISGIAGNYEYKVTNNEATITRYLGTEENVVVPGTLDGYTVVEIGQEAFLKNASVNSVTLPDSIKTIETFAFCNMSNLKSITLGANLNEIGYAAFQDCRELETIKFGDKLTYINWYAFENCKNLKQIELPASLKEIGKYAFTGSGLEEIKFNSNVKFGQTVFSRCKSLNDVEFSDEQETIELDIFDNCDNLKSITLGNNTKSLIPPGYGGYYESSITSSDIDMVRLNEIIVPSDNPYLKNIDGNVYSKDGQTLVYYLATNEATEYTIPDGVTTIGYRAFIANYSLEKITFSNTVTTIEDYAFNGCPHLTNVAFSNSVSSIGEKCFYKCYKLSKVNLPANIKSVGTNAFDKYQKTITVSGKYTQLAANAIDKKTTVLCGSSSKAAKYKAKINKKGKRIDYVLNGGVNNAANVYYFTKTFTLKNPTREGYTFAGWYSNSALTKKITKVTAGKNYKVYAKWIKNE